MKQGSEYFRCSFCGHTVASCKWGGGECMGCGSVLCSSLPTESELSAYYQKFNETYDGGHRGGENLIRYANRYFQILGRYVKKGRVVDVGSSRSPFPNIVARNGFSVQVIDYVEPQDLHPDVIFNQGCLNDVSVLEKHCGCYDAVSAWAVIEHVPNPQLACEILAKMCKPGGYIFLSTPEIGSMLTSNSIGRSSWFCPPEHLHLISALAIRRIFEKYDCELVVCGRLELNCLRWLVRYGIGAAEAIIGFPLKIVNAGLWRKLREERLQKYMGIAYYVICKRGNAL